MIRSDRHELVGPIDGSRSRASKLRRLIDEETEDVDPDLEIRRGSSGNCLYQHLSRRGCYEEALLAHQGCGHGKEFLADLMITCSRTGNRHHCSYPVTLCDISMRSDSVCGMPFRRLPPWTGHIDDCQVPLFPSCRLQLIVRSREDSSIAKVFLLNLDLEDMPAGSKTIVKQTGISHTLDSRSYCVHSDISHLLQFMIRRDSERRLQIAARIRLVLTLTKSATLLHKGRMTFPTGSEEYLELRTELPDPKYFVDDQCIVQDRCNIAQSYTAIR